MYCTGTFDLAAERAGRNALHQHDHALAVGRDALGRLRPARIGRERVQRRGAWRCRRDRRRAPSARRLTAAALGHRCRAACLHGASAERHEALNHKMVRIPAPRRRCMKRTITRPRRGRCFVAFNAQRGRQGQDRLPLHALRPRRRLGVDIRDGFKLARQARTAASSAACRPKCSSATTSSSPTSASSSPSSMLKRDKVDFMTGIVFSNIMLAALPDAFDSKTFYISPNAAPSPIAGKDCNPLLLRRRLAERRATTRRPASSPPAQGLQERLPDRAELPGRQGLARRLQAHLQGQGRRRGLHQARPARLRRRARADPRRQARRALHLPARRHGHQLHQAVRRRRPVEGHPR